MARILIADDDELVAELASELLIDAGYACGWVTTAASSSPRRPLALGLLAVATNTHMLLPLICALNVMEAGSVALQMGVFKASGRKKRLFKMSPIHHHFELLGWPETTVIIRFWILSGICVAVAVHPIAAVTVTV